MDFQDKNIAVVGPSKQALEAMDYNLLSNFDLVARTNLFLEHEEDLDDEQSRCDIIFLNGWSTRWYFNKKDRLKDVYVLTKLNRRFLPNNFFKILQGASASPVWRKLLKNSTFRSRLGKRKKTKGLRQYTPYLLTLACEYLLSRGANVTVFGVDFYYHGFKNTENYLDGVYRLPSTKKEESNHSMRRDLRYWEKYFFPNEKFHLSEEVQYYYERVKQSWKPKQ